MGEIAEMMLDGTMDFETGEWNFDGLDGPGFPMTGAQAAEFRRQDRSRRRAIGPTDAAFKVSTKLRKTIEASGELRQCDYYHWQVLAAGKVVADWWPHKRKWRVAGKIALGDEKAFVSALAAVARAEQSQ